MAYGKFALWYDKLNSDVDYDIIAGEISKRLKMYGTNNGIVADLGCGTGELLLKLADDGYDMIGIDASVDMLSIAREKLNKASKPEVLLLCQPLEEMDLYGTINAAVSSFDTFNHLTKKQNMAAFNKINLFMEQNGTFIFDVNTPYKHKEILADNTFIAEDGEGVECVWKNTFLIQEQATKIELEIYREDELLYTETFFEYLYSLSFWEDLLEKNSFEIKEVTDGETYKPLTSTSQRALFCATKR